MNWIALAIGGHLLNALAFVIDKILLNASFKQSATYAALIGSLSLLVFPAIPWMRAWPSWRLQPFIIAFGVLFVFALWGFFEALKRSEATRVVPLVGSLIPLFTYAGSALFLHERLTQTQTFGFAILVIATIFLTRGTRRVILQPTTIGLAAVAAFLFAVSSLCGKFAFSQASVQDVFIVSRLWAGFTGLSLFFCIPSIRHELFSAKKNSHGSRFFTPQIFLMGTGQLAGAIGFILVQISLAAGSASLVNALQAVQYATIVLIAWLGGKALATRLQEERTVRAIVWKSAAIVCVALGLFFLTS